ncbi:MAG: glycosyltransferase family 39 protein [Roseiflexaceae bacterium]|nr:glycosyltransferase family 39 protein [Roseiflexaceae bacterium]
MKNVVPPPSAVEDEVVASENGLPPAEPALFPSDPQQVSYAGANLFTLLLITLTLAWIGQVFLTSTLPHLWAGGALLTIAGAAFVVLGAWMRNWTAGNDPAAAPQFVLWLDHLPPYYLLFTLAFVSSGVAFWCAATPELRPLPALIAWLASMGFFLAGARLLDRRNDNGLEEEPWTRRELFAVVALTLVALALRMTMIDAIPQNFGGDEGEMGMEARGVLEGRITNPFVTGWLSHPTLWFFLQALSLSVFGNNVFGLRALSALIGMATVLLLYLFARPLFGRSVASGAAMLLAVFHFHIHFSRLGVNNIVDPLLALAAFIAFFTGMRRSSSFALGWSGVICGVAQHFYMGSRLTPLLIAVLIAHLVITDWRRFCWLAPRLPLIIGGFFLGFGPLIAHFINDPSALTARLAMVGVVQSGWLDHKLAEGIPLTHIILDQARQSFGAYTFVPDRGAWYDPKIALLDSASSVLLVLGAALALVNWRRPEWFLPVAWLTGAAVLGGMLLVNSPESPRYVTTAPALCLLVMLALQQIVALAGQAFRWTDRRRALLTAILVALLSGWSLNFYFRDYIPRRTYGWTNTEIATKLAHYVNAQPGPVYVYMFTPPRMFFGNGTIRFIASGVEGMDVHKPVTDSAQIMPPPDGKRPIFIFLPEREAELAVVQQRFPGGVIERFQGEWEPVVLFIAYTPP